MSEQRLYEEGVEELLANYNDGRSMSFYCLACTMMPPDSVSEAMNEAKRILTENRIDDLDLKARAKAMKQVIQRVAAERGIDLSPSGRGGWERSAEVDRQTAPSWEVFPD